MKYITIIIALLITSCEKDLVVPSNECILFTRIQQHRKTFYLFIEQDAQTFITYADTIRNIKMCGNENIRYCDNAHFVDVITYHDGENRTTAIDTSTIFYIRQ